MKTVATALMYACIALASGGAGAQDTMKKHDSMGKDGAIKKDMTMQECKDHMAMSKKDGTKKSDSMMKMDTMCADMMKGGGMMKDDSMKKDMPSEAVKK